MFKIYIVALNNTCYNSSTQIKGVSVWRILFWQSLLFASPLLFLQAIVITVLTVGKATQVSQTNGYRSKTIITTNRNNKDKWKTTGDNRKTKTIIDVSNTQKIVTTG